MPNRPRRPSLFLPRLAALLGALFVLLVSSPAWAVSKVYVTNNTPKPLRLKISSDLSHRYWNRRHTVVPPFARRAIFETNRDEGVKDGKTYTFTAKVVARDSKDGSKVHVQDPNDFQIKLKLKGTPTHSHMWQSHRGQGGTLAPWQDDRDVHETAMFVGGRRWGVKYWAYFTGGDDDVEYVFREDYPRPTGFGKRLPKEWKQNHLNVLSYNIYMRPTALFLNAQSQRMKEIPAQLRGYDVIVFSEMFDDDLRDVLVSKMKAYGYKHASKPLSADGYAPLPIGGGAAIALDVLQDGGVIIFSRHPIVDQDQFVYEKCTAEDCLSAKGAVWIRINKRVKGTNNFFNVLGTHLDSTSPTARFAQLAQLKTFIDSRKAIRKDEPVLIAGDLNINMWSNGKGGSRKLHDHFEHMLELLDAGYFSGSQIRGHLPKDLTHDGPINDLGSGSKSYLDYVLWSKAHRPVTPASFVETRVPRAHHEYKDVETDKARWDLSDHYAVYASLHFADKGLGFDPGDYDPPGSTPLYMCTHSTDCPSDLICDKSQGVPKGAVPPPSKGGPKSTTTALPKSGGLSKKKGVSAGKAGATGGFGKVGKAKAGPAKPKKFWSGVCRIPPPK